MVKPRLLGLRLGLGGGGTMKPGEFGADIDLGLGCADFGSPSEVCGRFEGVVGVGTVRERFFVFRGFLLGESDLLYPRPGEGGTTDKSSTDDNPDILWKGERGRI